MGVVSKVNYCRLSIALIALTNTAIAGGPIGEHSLMNDFLRSKVSMGRDFSVSTDSPAYNNETNNALVFNRGAIGVDNHDFDDLTFWLPYSKQPK
jgi:hypothetical protein